VNFLVPLLCILDFKTARRLMERTTMKDNLPELTSKELARYDRQLGPGVLTQEGQQRLKRSTALITRVGGMGGPASLALTMAGVGRVIIAHGGNLISPDLNRQVLGAESGLDQPRVPAFGDYLRSMNRFVEVEALDHEPDDAEADELASRCDIIVACPPTFEERLRLNRAAVTAGIPLIDAAQWGMSGTLAVFRPGTTACLECVYPEAPPFEEMFPVVGAISSAIGSLAALEAIKILSGCGKPMWGQLLTCDAFNGYMNKIDLKRRADCPCCGQG
jgi:molybdopterin/thiamine biosynthesis adenylyltransferase